MSTTIAIINNKGGVGKTSCTISLGAALARKNKKVLLIDLDGQANLSMVFSSDPDTQYNIGRVLLNQLETEEIVIKGNTLDLLPGSREHHRIEKALTLERAAEGRLRKHLKKLQNKYDYIIIDCPPNLGNFTTNALTVADYYLIPATPEYFGFKGIQSLLVFIEEIQKDDLNDNLKLLGILLNQYNPKQRNKARNAIAKAIQDDELKVFETYVRQDTNMMKSVANGKTVFEYNKESKIAQDYEAFADEVLTLTK